MFDGFAFTTAGEIAAAMLAVTLVGLAKGGLGGAMALMAVPLMSLAIPPVQAAGILLPILIVMDGVSLWTWRGKWDRALLRSLLPGGLLGIGIGWATAAFVSDGAVRLIVGAVGLLFALRWFLQGRAARVAAREQNQPRALFWSTLSGYTSFVAHAGGPPYQVYTMPLRMEPAIYTATSVLFFAVMNVVKLVPYAALGQLAANNLLTSAALMPLAAVATVAGAAIVKRLRMEIFYPFMYAMVLIVALKLIWDGIAAFG